jgi:RecB family endonuclease NucS
VTVERVFRSGDCADIVWRREDGRYVVVEVETYFPEPGAYQALKYRCLLCAEMGLDLTSPNVEAWVVAREIPESLRALCTRYGIRFEEIE